MFHYYPFQDPSTPIMEGIIDLHTYIMFYLIGIGGLVFFLTPDEVGGRLRGLRTRLKELKDRLRRLEDDWRDGRARGEDTSEVEVQIREVERQIDQIWEEFLTLVTPGDPERPPPPWWRWWLALAVGVAVGAVILVVTPPGEITLEDLLHRTTPEVRAALLDELIRRLSRGGGG